VGPGVCSYIENEQDYARANEILLRLGAVTEEPLRLPRAALLAAAIIIVAVALYVSTHWY
jgi:hypothetical protein